MKNKIKKNNEYPKVIVLILTWNNYNDSYKCIDSVKSLEYQNYEIVVVDNKSTDGSIQKIRRDFPDNTYILNTKNFYFSEGNNKAIRKVLQNKKVDFIFLLNNDTIITNKKTLHRLVEFLEDNDRRGIVSAKPVYPDGSNQIDLFSLRFPSISSFILVNSFLGRFYAKRKSFFPSNLSYCSSLCVDWVPIGISLIRKEIFSKCNFDGDSFPMEFSDVDFCKQVSLKTNQKIYLMNNITIVHSHSFPNTAEKLEINFTRAKYAELRYVAKYFSKSYLLIYKFLNFINSLFYIIILPLVLFLFIHQRRKIYLKWKNHLLLIFKIWQM